MLGIKVHVLDMKNSMVILLRTLTHSFRQFHTISMQVLLLVPFLGQFQHVGYEKACTQADKFIGDTGRGCKHEKGAEGPKQEAQGLQRGQKAPQQLSARARLFGTMRQNTLVYMKILYMV